MKRLGTIAVAGSFALHGFGLAALARARTPIAHERARSVTLALSAPEPPRAVSPPPPAPPSAPASAPRDRARRAATAAPRPLPAPAAPVAATPQSPPAPAADPDGTVDGNGEPGSGPRAANPPAPIAAPPAPRPVPPSRPAPVPLRELGTRPTPPDLSAALASRYPAEARRLGQSGSARVRALLAPDGRVTTTQISAESEPGFGAACRGVLAGSRWTAPRDREGRAVATWVSYTCRFSARR